MQLTGEGSLGAVEGGDGEVVSRLEEGLAALDDGRRDLVGACEVSTLHNRRLDRAANRAARGPKPKLKAEPQRNRAKRNSRSRGGRAAVREKLGTQLALSARSLTRSNVEGSLVEVGGDLVRVDEVPAS